VPRRHKVLTHGQERLFRKVTSVSIHSFVEWLDTFSYVMRPTDVTVKEVNHIRCFAIDIANILYSFPVVLLWDTCVCCIWRPVVAFRRPKSIKDTLVRAAVSRPSSTSASVNHVVTSVASAVSNYNIHKCPIARRQERSIHFFQFLSNDDGQCLKFSLKRDGK
jgi:hypothetical protein